MKRLFVPFPESTAPATNRSRLMALGAVAEGLPGSSAPSSTASQPLLPSLRRERCQPSIVGRYLSSGDGGDVGQ